MDFYAFVEGPLLWFAFLTFMIGTVLRMALVVARTVRMDQPMVRFFRWKYVLATFARWLLPLNKDMLKNPVFMTLVYVFHICLIVVPVFLGGHVALWDESRFEWSWPSIPDVWADWMTLTLIAISLFFFLRRLISADIRLISTLSDYLLIVVTALPFVTGYFLSHGTVDSVAFIGENITLIHMLSGELMLILIPLTRLSHSFLFFFSRAATGIEFGRRGYSM